MKLQTEHLLLEQQMILCLKGLFPTRRSAFVSQFRIANASHWNSNTRPLLPAGQRHFAFNARRSSSGLSSPSSPSSSTEAELEEARKWLENLGSETIPRSVTEITFSRSSGPGGQNVNKVNSKVTLRVPFTVVFSRVPGMLHHELRAHSWYAKNSDSLVLSADGSRKKSDNVTEVFRKLEGLLRETGQRLIPGRTSKEQKEKVEMLKKVEHERRKMRKEKHKSKKQARKGFSDD